MSEHGSSPEIVQAPAEVVVLSVTPGGLVPVEGDTPIDLAVPEPLAEPLVGQLLDSRVRLIAPTEAPYELIEAIKEQHIPPAFADNAWLSRYRVLVFEEGRCTIRGFRLRYSRRFGILIDGPEDPRPTAD
ncbi:hypothetical protein [Nonomuraea wenchangensis]|uniref:hypothetical protein n=1 Tax=Nonomuraea wenchangensis TaxID=568860 RepID=UPI00331C4AE0